MYDSIFSPHRESSSHQHYHFVSQALNSSVEGSQVPKKYQQTLTLTWPGMLNTNITTGCGDAFVHCADSWFSL